MNTSADSVQRVARRGAAPARAARAAVPQRAAPRPQLQMTRGQQALLGGRRAPAAPAAPAARRPQRRMVRGQQALLGARSAGAAVPAVPRPQRQMARGRQALLGRRLTVAAPATTAPMPSPSAPPPTRPMARPQPAAAPAATAAMPAPAVPRAPRPMARIEELLADRRAEPALGPRRLQAREGNANTPACQSAVQAIQAASVDVVVTPEGGVKMEAIRTLMSMHVTAGSNCSAARAAAGAALIAYLNSPAALAVLGQPPAGRAWTPRAGSRSQAILTSSDVTGTRQQLAQRLAAAYWFP